MDIFAKANTDLRIDKQKRCNHGQLKINNSRQQTGFIFVIYVKNVFIQEIEVSRKMIHAIEFAFVLVLWFFAAI